MKTKFLLSLITCCLLFTAVFAAETEPNNTRAQANTLALNGSNSGKINPAAEQDWWKVTTTGDGKLDVTLTPLSGRYTWVYLYDNDGTTQLNASYSTAGFTISTDGLAAGTYYLKVICYYTTDTSSYTISNTLTQPAQTNDAEPNDTKAQALVLPLNSNKKGHIDYYYNNHRDSTDWYKITTPADGLLRLTLTPANGQYTWAYLYDNDGTTLLNSGTSTAAFSLSTDGLAAGTYYVRVNSYYNTGFAPYTLADSLFSPTQANDTEPNDTKATALTLPVNSTTTGHVDYYYNNRRDSADWYKLTTATDGLLRLTLTPANGQYTWVYLYDRDGTTLLNSGYSTAAFSISTDGLAVGTYYVRVNTYYNNGFAPYTLADSLFTYSYAADAEPNNQPYLGRTLPANGTVTGHVGFYYNNQRDSSDWWKINYTGSGPLTITANFELTKLSGGYQYTYLQIWKDTLAAPIYNNYTAGPSLVASLTSLTKGYYWVRIITYYNNGFESYSLSNTFTQVEKAKVKIVSSDTSAACNNANSITFKCSKSQAPYTVQLYKFGTPYGSVVTVNNTKNFTISNLPHGYYYAKVYGDGATGSAAGKSKFVELVPTPTGTSTTNITGTSAKLNWSPVTCASYFTIQYRKQGTTPWTVKKTNGNVSFYNLTGLTVSTTYQWQVLSSDTANGTGGDGAYSPIATFTTAASFAQPVIANSTKLLQDNNNRSLTIYPNPARNSVTLDYKGSGDIVSVQITDLSGKKVISKTGTAVTSFHAPLNVSNLQAGVYMVTIVTSKNEVITSKLTISK